MRAIANWGGYCLLETFSDEYKPLRGPASSATSPPSSAGRRGTRCADIVVADELRTVIANQDRGQDDASWARRVEVWRDRAGLVGASDAGAHLDMIDTLHASRPRCSPERCASASLLPLEEAIHYLTGAPGRAVRPAGPRPARRAAGTPTSSCSTRRPIGPGPVHTRFDLPGGAGRVYGEAEGIAPRARQRRAVRRGRRVLDARPGHAAASRPRHRHGHRGLSGSHDGHDTPHPAAATR